MGPVAQRGIWLAEAGQRRQLAAFVDRAARLDAAAVIRLRARAGGLLTAWAKTGFDALACRAVAGRLRPDDLCAGAAELAQGLTAANGAGYVDPGAPADSAWRGALPPEAGFTHLDEVPAQVMRDLARRGAQLATEHGSSRSPPAWLLDQEVVAVSAADVAVGIPMRCLFALSAMGFLPAGGDEPVRVRVQPAWLRIDARFGSVYRRRGDPALLS